MEINERFIEAVIDYHYLTWTSQNQTGIFRIFEAWI